MTFSNLSVAALSQHLPEVLALPPYDPSAPKAAPVATPPARTELERLDDALHLFREVCPSLRLADLRGDANVRSRAAILSVLEGRRVPQAKAGFNAVRAALFAAAHDNEGSLAERTANFESFASLYLNPPTVEEVAEGVAEAERELAAEQAPEVLAPADDFRALCRESIEQINRAIEEGREAAAITAAPLPAKSEIEPTTTAPAVEVEPVAAPHNTPATCATVLSDEQGHVIIRYRSPQGSEGDCVIQVSPGGQVDVFMSTAPKVPTYSTETLPIGDLDTLSLILLSEGGHVPTELCFSTAKAEGEALLPPDAPKAKAAKASAEPKTAAPSKAERAAARAAERERQKAERAARTASRAAKKASKGKGKAARAAHAI